MIGKTGALLTLRVALTEFKRATLMMERKARFVVTRLGGLAGHGWLQLTMAGHGLSRGSHGELEASYGWLSPAEGGSG